MKPVADFDAAQSVCVGSLKIERVVLQVKSVADLVRFSKAI